MTTRTLDRNRHVDIRSLSYPVEVTTKAPRSYTWLRGTVLDQGQEGACVGFGWSAELSARPSAVAGIDNNFALTLYHQAQKFDEWAGENYSGSSVLAGAKVLQKAGYITEYRWCLTIDDLIYALGHQGPVVIGVDWYTGMFNVDKAGFIRPTGKIEGGHCTLLHGITIVKNADGTINYLKSSVIGVNSWGVDWGVFGRFRIALVDMMVLFQGGDFAVPMGRKLIPTTSVSSVV